MKLIGKFKDKKTRKYLFVEVPDNSQIPDGHGFILGRHNDKRGILGDLIDAHQPLIPTYGGVGSLDFIVITPALKYFYAIDYSKDLEGWKQQIEKGAKIIGVRLAKIVDEKYFQIIGGEKYLLTECEFEHYNFKYKENGEWKTHKERKRLAKSELFEIHRTHEGKEYTKEEWEKYKEEQRKNRPPGTTWSLIDDE